MTGATRSFLLLVRPLRTRSCKHRNQYIRRLASSLIRLWDEGISQMIEIVEVVLDGLVNRKVIVELRENEGPYR